jgi:cytochrome P450 family 135
MRGYGEMMVDVASREIARWPVGEPFALWPRMQSLSMEVVMRAVFGDTHSVELDELRVLLRRLTDWLNNPRRLTLLTALGPRWLTRNRGFRQAIEPVEAAVLREVARRRALPGDSADDGILALLEQAHHESGAPMTQLELRDELITLLSDGPTATSLAWVFERLLRHPDKLARLREEVLAGDDGAYTDAVVKETLRLCPAVPLVMRKLAQPMELGGYPVPAGTIVAPCVYLIHQRPDTYPQPRAFLPERFLEQAGRRPIDTYTWIPFGGGVRRCVAASFAQMEMKSVIQTIVRLLDLRPIDTRSERPARSSIAFVPDQSGQVIATPRKSAAARDSQLSPDPQTATVPAAR